MEESTDNSKTFSDESPNREEESEVDVNLAKCGGNCKGGESDETEKSVADDNVSDTSSLSKRQRKKLLKRQKWLDTRLERKKREKGKLRQRLEAKRAAGEACGNIRKKLKQVTMAASKCKQRVVIDMSFDNLMIEKHLCQCIKQVSRCYSANRRVTDPMQLYVTSFTGKSETLMARQNGYLNWDVHFKQDYYMNLFPKDEIVYLSSESENVLTSLDDKKIYIIGGLVDHNVHKGLCYKLAVEKGIQHAKLPIDDFIEMKTRKVLTVDHVFRILLGVSHGKSWKDSFLAIIPARKGAVGKDDPDSEDDLVSKECEEESNTEILKGVKNVAVRNYILRDYDDKECNEQIDELFVKNKETENRLPDSLDRNTVDSLDRNTDNGNS